jgi:uncharacterized protein (TIGR02246 family)
MHDVLRLIAVFLLIAGLLVSALGVVRWAKRRSAGTAIGFGGLMLVLAALAFLLRDLAARDLLVEFAQRYTAAWCSHDPARVASFYSESGLLAINNGAPAVGRKAVEAAARSFMTGYPDLVVKFDRIVPKGERVLYHWTFIGTNTGPGGTGNRVRIRGYEDWTIGTDGLIATSVGHFDAQDWDRQVKGTAALPK